MRLKKSQMESAEYSQLGFTSQYEEALKASGSPSVEKVRRLVVDMIEDVDSVNDRSEGLGSLITFVRERLQNNDVPINWLTGDLLLGLCDTSSSSQGEKVGKGSELREEDVDIFYRKIAEADAIELSLSRVEGSELGPTRLARLKRRVAKKALENWRKRGGDIRQVSKVLVTLMPGSGPESYSAQVSLCGNGGYLDAQQYFIRRGGA